MLWNHESEITCQNYGNQKEQNQSIYLRSFSLTDINDFMEWASDDEVTKYMMWNSYTDYKQAEDFFIDVIDKHPWFKAICFGDKIIGSITLDKGKNIHYYKAELGYVISRKYWGLGCATLAIRLAIKEGFESLNVNRIEAFVDPTNIASQRVLKKNQFIKEGLLKNNIIQKGVLKDRYLYAIHKNIKVLHINKTYSSIL